MCARLFSPVIKMQTFNLEVQLRDKSPEVKSAKLFPQSPEDVMDVFLVLFCFIQVCMIVSVVRIPSVLPAATP